MRGREHRRQARRVAARRADWQRQVVVPVGSISAVMAAPLARRLRWDRKLRGEVYVAAGWYGERNGVSGGMP